MRMHDRVGTKSTLLLPVLMVLPLLVPACVYLAAAVGIAVAGTAVVFLHFFVAVLRCCQLFWPLL